MLEYKKTFKDAKKRRGANLCISGDLNMLDHHLKSAEMGNKYCNYCKVCGAIAYSKCRTCGVNLHLMANRGQSAGLTCFFITIMTLFLGLAHCDAHISKVKQSVWNYPAQAKGKDNTRVVKAVKKDM